MKLVKQQPKIYIRLGKRKLRNIYLFIFIATMYVVYVPLFITKASYYEVGKVSSYKDKETWNVYIL